MKRENRTRMKTRKKTAGPVSDEQQKITITKNGPYSVTGEIPLSNPRFLDLNIMRTFVVVS